MNLSASHQILLVEDDETIRDMMRDALCDEGYEVVEAGDGGGAIDALRVYHHSPERLCLVILDMMLPITDGVHVLNALAGLGSFVPVLAVSADRRQLDRAAQAGAATTLLKPYDLDRLLDTVEQVRR